MMMATTMDGRVYIIGINTVKKKKYEKISIGNSSFIPSWRFKKNPKADKNRGLPKKEI